MTLAKILAAAAVSSIGFSATAFAAIDYVAVKPLEIIGVDVTKASSTDEDRMVFWNAVASEQATSAKQMGLDALSEAG